MSLTIFRVSPDRREAIREAMVATRARGKNLSVRKIREHCGGRTDSIALLLRALRDGHLSLDSHWDGRVSSLNLEEAIRSISSHDDRTRIQQEIAAQLAGGTLTPTVAKALQDSLNAARLSAKAAQDATGSAGDAEPVYLLDESTFLVAKVVNRIASPEILQEVLTFVAEAGERDLKEFSNPTLAQVEALRGPQQRVREQS